MVRPTSLLSSLVLPLICGISLPVSAEAQRGEESLTLEAIFEGEEFASTNPTDIRWLPDGASFLFQHKQADGNGLWRASVATGKRTRVADWGEVVEKLRSERPGWSRQDIREVSRAAPDYAESALSPDGRLLAGVEADDLYLFDLGAGSARWLTNDPSPEMFPTFSPDGAKLAFAKEGDLYWIDLEEEKPRRLTDRGERHALLNGVADWVYEEEFDVRRSFWWSPDGEAIAFVQYDTSPVTSFPITDNLQLIAGLEEQKYPKAGGANSTVRLGVMRLERPGTLWVDLGGEEDFYLPRADWLPDGSGLWYQWLNREQTRLELRFVDLKDGEYRAVLADEDPTWINVRHDMRFLDEDRFLWSSERDGWRHLYLYDVAGNLLQRLTRGRWQVEEVYGFNADSSEVFFQATERDPRERHIYRVGLDGSGFRRLSRDTGTHAAILSPTGGHFIDTFSDHSTPPRIDLYRSDGTQVRTISDGTIPALAAYRLAPLELGTVRAEDGTTLYTAMFRPPDFDPQRKYPVLVYVYGGPHAQVVRDSWDARRYLFFQLLAQRGFIVFWLDNRGSWGRGKAFESVIHRRLGEWELEDQLAGVRYLRTLPYVDSDRIGVYGGSYGGYMALTCLLKAPQHFKVGIAYAPVTDWRLYDTIYTERYMDSPQDNAEGYHRSAPLSLASRLEGKLLLAHGSMDNNVHVQNTLQMVEELVKAGKTFELMIYPRVRHGIRTSRYKLHFHQLKTEFLMRNLVGE